MGISITRKGGSGALTSNQKGASMSVDNGIYILQSLDGFRVAHAQAIENLWCWDEFQSQGLNPKYLSMYFEKAELIKNEEDALKEALRLFKEISSEGYPIEYGIVPITGWETKEFPS
jgi:hypothetical protein